MTEEFTQEFEDEITVLVINEVHSDAKSITITGTTIVPEFGTITAMILAVATISIIAVSARSRLNIIPRI